MTLEQLRIFAAVAEREHMTRAAEALHLTQSAVSAAIAGLEQHYRVKLFDRVGRGIMLTEAGRVLLAEARGTLARAASAEQAMADYAGLRHGKLAIHASQTIASYFLPPLLVRFQARYPGIEPCLAVGNTAQVARAVKDGAAEIGFVEGPLQDPALSVEAVAVDQMVIVVPPGHEWADGAALTRENSTRTGLGVPRGRLGHTGCLYPGVGRQGVAGDVDSAYQRGGARRGGGRCRGGGALPAGLRPQLGSRERWRGRISNCPHACSTPCATRSATTRKGLRPCWKWHERFKDPFSPQRWLAIAPKAVIMASIG